MLERAFSTARLYLTAGHVGLLCLSWLLLTSLSAGAQTVPGSSTESISGNSAGPIRLRAASAELPAASAVPPAGAANAAAAVPTVARAPGEFETFVGLPRFGADMVNELAISAGEYNPIVPPDYVVQPGDELQVTMWGSVDADLRLLVDRGGRVVIPRVGPVMVAGSRHGDLKEVLTRRVAQVFKSFELSVSLGRLRGQRVYVTGFVQRPGAYAVAGLSTVVNAVMRAGGPTAAGSFRRIELRREGRLASTLDLYDLLLRGDRAADLVLQPDDVVHVPPVGPQAGLRGSVNQPAVFELRPGEQLDDLLSMGGGFSPVADRSRVAIERIDERKSQLVVQLSLPAAQRSAIVDGDVVRVFSAVDASLSSQLQNKRVRVEGEVFNPGELVLPPGSTLEDALRAAGGLTPLAYLYGAQFTRETVRVTQQENYDRALRDLETEFARTSGSLRVASVDDVATQSAKAAATARLVERLRALKPNGRVVLQVEPGARELPPLLLEDGDRLLVPARPTSVGVFGSVFNSGSYLHVASRTIDDYLRLAGGPTKGADESSVFVVRANGQVASSRQKATLFGRDNALGGTLAEPGDTVFVPEETDKSTFIQTAKDWTLLFYQLGVGAAGIRSAVR